MPVPVPEVVRLADEYWDHHRATAQLWNVDRGDVEQIEHWEDLSPAGVDARARRLAGFADRAAVLSAAVGGDREGALLAAVAFSARSTAATLPYARDLTLVAGPFDIATFLTVLVPGYVLVTRRHGDGYVAKLRAFPAFVDGWIAGLRDGLAGGRVATARGVAHEVAALDRLLATGGAGHPLASQPPPAEASAAEADAWRQQVVDAVRTSVQPALARLRAFLHDDVLPAARPDDRAGICHLPGGEAGYRDLLWAATSTDHTPEAVHELGRSQLALLDAEYRAVGPAAIGGHEPAEVRERLRSDPALRYATAGDVVAAAMAALARATAAAPEWFTRLPGAPCTAAAVGSGPLAYYTAPSPDGARGGTFFFNTSDPAAWSRCQLEVTTFHEAVPGHHLQLALAQELDLHPVLGELEVTSYGEGWGLYAERLADEMSLYSSPLQRLGMLTLDSLRAARLVVDTGLHAMGWSRGQAVDALLRTTALDRRTAEAEIDRYVADPGQATSYMIGRLEIERLRRDAASRLGARFSLRGFHDTVLGGGMTPLPELGRTVDRWVEASLAGPATAHAADADVDVDADQG